MRQLRFEHCIIRAHKEESEAFSMVGLTGAVVMVTCGRDAAQWRALAWLCVQQHEINPSVLGTASEL
jgi:hypothetical protein